MWGMTTAADYKHKHYKYCTFAAEGAIYCVCAGGSPMPSDEEVPVIIEKVHTSVKRRGYKRRTLCSSTVQLEQFRLRCDTDFRDNF